MNYRLCIVCNYELTIFSEPKTFFNNCINYKNMNYIIDRLL